MNGQEKEITMSKRGNNIHKRKDGCWEGRFKKGQKPDGTIAYGSLYRKTYKEVKLSCTDVYFCNSVH